MSPISKLIAAVSFVALTFVPSLISAAPAQPRNGESAVAERLAQSAQVALTVRNPQMTDAEQAAALLNAASRLDPSELRFARLWVESELQINKPELLLAALKAQREIDADDRIAQMRVVETHFQRMQTEDARVQYVTGLLEKNSLPQEVRSHAAVLAAKSFMERGQEQESADMINKAVLLNPLNVEALTFRYEKLLRTGTSFERVKALLAILRANPALAEYVRQLAREAASAGAIEAALPWFNAGYQLSVTTQRVEGDELADFAVEMAAATFLAGDPVKARDLLETVMRSVPGHVQAGYMRLVVLHNRNETRKDFEAASAVLEDQLMGELAAVRNRVRVGDPATRPTTQPGSTRPVIPFDPKGDVAAIRASGDDRAASEYFSVGVDLAWLLIYFQERPARARDLVEALKSMVPAGDTTVTRLQGWLLIGEQQLPAAANVLGAIADKDPLAALGLWRIASLATEPKVEREVLQTRARKILSDNPSGFVAAIVHSALSEVGGKRVLSESARGVVELLAQFPLDSFGVVQRPDTVYSIRLEPLKVVHEFGEPVLARLTIVNMSNVMPLTIGEMGLLNPEFFLDATIMGQPPRDLPAYTGDRLPSRTVLAPRQQMSMLIRLDVGPLMSMLPHNLRMSDALQDPTVPVTISPFVTTNPSIFRGQTVSRAGGYTAKAQRNVIRGTLTATSDAVAELGRQLTADTDAEVRVRVIEALATIALMPATRRDRPDAKLEDAAAAALTLLAGQVEKDPSPAVRIYARYLMALSSPPAQRQAHLQALLTSDVWWSRLLGLNASRIARDFRLIDSATLRSLGTTFSTDKDATVARYAKALVEYADVIEAAATRASRPATVPATQPAGR